MNYKVGAFCELIDFLHRKHSRWLRDPNTKGKMRELNDRVNATLRVIDERRLKVLLREVRAGGSVDFLSKDAFLFLAPPEEGELLPVLSIKSDFRKSELRIRMALFTFDKSATPVAIGFRFETPEGEGHHNYHHAQLITSFGSGTEDLPTPPWLPTHQPALMMSAKNPFALFLGVLIGLYGLGYLERQWRTQRFVEPLTEDLIQLKIGCGAPLDQEG